MTAVMSRMYIPVSDITFLTNLPYPGISVMKHYHKMFTITVLTYRAVNYSGVLNIGITNIPFGVFRRCFSRIGYGLSDLLMYGQETIFKVS